MAWKVTEGVRKEFVEKNIVKHLTSPERVKVEPKLNEVIVKYKDLDEVEVNALSLMAYAAEKGRLSEFLARLDNQFENNLKFRHPELRGQFGITNSFGVDEVHLFFEVCYGSLGIKPTPQNYNPDWETD